MARESNKTQVQRKERLGKRKVTEKKKERDGEKRGKKEQEKKRERKRSIPPPFLSIFSLLTKRRARYCTYLPTISFYRPKPGTTKSHGRSGDNEQTTDGATVSNRTSERGCLSETKKRSSQKALKVYTIHTHTHTQNQTKQQEQNQQNHLHGVKSQPQHATPTPPSFSLHQLFHHKRTSLVSFVLSCFWLCPPPDLIG
jgi:hypothetical protein